MKRFSALVLVCALMGATSLHAGTYSGMLTFTPPAGTDDGIVTTGSVWDSTPSTFSWTVTDSDTSHADHPWKYTYSFNLGSKKSATSHFILEVSDTFTADKITGLSGATIDSIGMQSVGSGNPGMPENVYGIRFDPVADDSFTFNWSFYSSVAPVWGDFYAKSGKQGGVTNAAWNKGFSSLDVDPLAVASNGSVGNHVLRPDTASNLVPLPQAVYPGLALLMALCATKFLRRARD